MDLPNPGIELGSPALQEDSLTTELLGKPASITKSVVKDVFLNGLYAYVGESP